MARFSKFSDWLRNPLNLASCIALVCWLGYAGHFLWPTIFRLWFFSSDEYVIVAEIIRFSQLDFRQHFFDNPGTFFMLLNMPFWAAFYAAERVFGVTSGGIGVFTFAHLPSLFGLARAVTIASFLASVVLTFAVAARVINAGAAAVAALLLAMSPIYGSYSSFVRTDSLALVCMLAAILVALGERGDDAGRAPALRDRAVIAGILVGLAAGARLHSASAALPILLMLFWTRAGYAKPDYPKWARNAARIFLPLSWALAAAVWRLSGRISMPGARRFVLSVVAAWLALSLAAAILYRIPRARRLVVAIASPNAIKLALGCAAGGVLGNPTVLRQYSYFLASVDMYSKYRDLDRAQWPFWTDVQWYVAHYLKVIAPDKLTLALLGAGALLILARRDRKLLPFLAAAALFFVSKPLTLVAAEHHAILWLPFFYIVCGYPAGLGLEWLARRAPRGNAAATASLAVFLAAAFYALTPGPALAAANAARTDVRLRNIAAADDWIRGHTGPGETVASTYFCFNPQTFYAWLRSLEVPVPDSAFDGRENIIWWGQRSALRGKAGYACATRADISSMKTNLDLASPGEGTDPYTEPGFQWVRSFGSEDNEVDVFRFDHRTRQ